MLSLIFSIGIIIGGVSIYAQERYQYELVAVNNKSKVATVMQVYATSERDAKENVSANGWKVVSIRQLTYKMANSIDLGELELPSNVDNGTAAVVQESQMPANDEDLINSLMGSPEVAVTVPQPATPEPTPSPTPPPVTPAITPDSEDVEYIFTVYFDFAVSKPIITEKEATAIAALDKTKEYYLFGNTDNVSVMPNKEYKNNYDLSYQRAEAVKELMIKNGINPANIHTVGLGSLYPEVQNRRSSSGTPLNRRVEIYGFKQKT